MEDEDWDFHVDLDHSKAGINVRILRNNNAIKALSDILNILN